MFYDRFAALCKSRGVSPSRAAEDAGLSKSTVTKWKRTPDARPTGNVIEKLTKYFGLSVAELLGEEEAPPAPAGEEAVKFALSEVPGILPMKCIRKCCPLPPM